MRSFYAACDLGVESGRVMLGTLHEGKLTMSEVRCFPNLPLEGEGGLQWNIPQLYQEILAGLCDLGSYEEAVEGISCHSWPADYLLFDADGALITPTYHRNDSRTLEGMQKVCARVSPEAIYQETRVQLQPAHTLFQLGLEKSRRLYRTALLLPVADAFNYLLAGVPRVELSLAGATQLYNPVTRSWSSPLVQALGLPPKVLPPLVPAGTRLGGLRPEIARKTGLDDTQVVATCSHETAAALMGLPIASGESWAYLRLGTWAEMGIEPARPIITEPGGPANFSTETGYGGAIRISKQAVGLWILEECRRFWKERDREIDDDLLTHLAGSAPPFESLINPTDPRFLAPGDMPLKIQAFCRETSQPMPRKPGAMIRCVLESVALLYRTTLAEIEAFTGGKVARLHVISGVRNPLLHHFIANAVQRPVVVAPADVSAIGNVLVQALALGHLGSLEQAREVIRNSFKVETLSSHAVAWNTAYARQAQLLPG